MSRSLGVVGHRQVGGVDHHQLGLPCLARGIGGIRREVELLLHARDVGVGLLDVEARAGTMLGVVADVAVDDHHRLLGDVRVLERRHAVVLGAVDDLLVGHRRVVGDDVGRAGGAAHHPRLHVVVAEARAARIRHAARELLQVGGGRVVADRLRGRKGRAVRSQRDGGRRRVGEHAHRFVDLLVALSSSRDLRLGRGGALTRATDDRAAIVPETFSRRPASISVKGGTHATPRTQRIRYR